MLGRQRAALDAGHRGLPFGAQAGGGPEHLPPFNSQIDPAHLVGIFADQAYGIGAVYHDCINNSKAASAGADSHSAIGMTMSSGLSAWEGEKLHDSCRDELELTLGCSSLSKTRAPRFEA